MNLSQKISYLMKKNNIKTSKELSRKLEEENMRIPYTTLLTIINGETTNIKLETANKLCYIFKITLNELLDDVDNIDVLSELNSNVNKNEFYIKSFVQSDNYEEYYKLLKEFEKVNNKGKEKVIEYIDVLIKAGDYACTNSTNDENTELKNA